MGCLHEIVLGTCVCLFLINCTEGAFLAFDMMVNYTVGFLITSIVEKRLLLNDTEIARVLLYEAYCNSLRLYTLIIALTW